MNNPANHRHRQTGPFEAFQLLYFSKLLNRRIRRDKTNAKNGRLTDLVFRLSEPYPERSRHPEGHQV